MTAPTEDTTELTNGGFIRGAGAVHVNGRRVARVLIGLAILTLAALIVAFTVSAAQHNSRIAQLKKHGVPVTATVTGCVGMASGTGITEYGFNCRGTFRLRARSYNEAISGTRDLLVVGQRVPAVAVSTNPAILYTAAAAADLRESFTVYVTPLVLLGVVVAAGAVWLRLRPTKANGEGRRRLDEDDRGPFGEQPRDQQIDDAPAATKVHQSGP